MTDYRCPASIKDLFATATEKEITEEAATAYFAWMGTLKLQRGDRAEVFGGDSGEFDQRWYWWDYNPDN